MKAAQIVLLSAALMLGQSQASAAVAARTFGNPDCGQWFTNPTSKTWLLGFLSGLNMVIAQEKADPLSRLNSADQAFLWMDNYCKVNPLNTVSDGAQELYIEVRKK